MSCDGRRKHHSGVALLHNRTFLVSGWNLTPTPAWSRVNNYGTLVCLVFISAQKRVDTVSGVAPILQAPFWCGTYPRGDTLLGVALIITQTLAWCGTYLAQTPYLMRHLPLRGHLVRSGTYHCTNIVWCGICHQHLVWRGTYHTQSPCLVWPLTLCGHLVWSGTCHCALAIVQTPYECGTVFAGPLLSVH